MGNRIVDRNKIDQGKRNWGCWRAFIPKAEVATGWWRQRRSGQNGYCLHSYCAYVWSIVLVLLILYLIDFILW